MLDRNNLQEDMFIFVYFQNGFFYYSRKDEVVGVVLFRLVEGFSRDFVYYSGLEIEYEVKVGVVFRYLFLVIFCYLGYIF